MMNRVLVQVVSLLGLAALALPVQDVAAAPPDPALQAAGAKAREATRNEVHARVEAKLSVLKPFAAPHVSKAESATKGADFDRAGFSKGLEGFEAKPLTQAALADLVKTWEGKLESHYSKSTAGIQDNSRSQLAGKLNSTLIGKMLSFVSSNRPTGSTGGGDDKGGGDKHSPPVPVRVVQSKIRLNTVLMPTGGFSSPDGLLHVHAMTHDPSGNPAESYAALAQELAIGAGTTSVAVDVPFRTTLSLALATTPAGHAVAESSIRLRVMEKRNGGLGKELCSAGMLIASAEAVVIGLGHQEVANRSGTLSCRFRRSTTAADQYVVIFEDTGYAMVQGPGAAHALLDTVIDTVVITTEHP